MKTLWQRRTGIGAVVALGVVTPLALVALTGVGSAAAAEPPDNTAPPTISGTPEVGETMTATTGTWSGTEPITYKYQWRRCDDAGGSCSNISGATEKTYALKSNDVGNTVRVRVTATNSSGSATETSTPSAVIKQATPKPSATGCPAGTGPVKVDDLSPPARLALDGQSLSPSVVGRSTNELTARFHVSACGGRAVQGALVYVTAVPYNQFTVPNEQPTGADGWAQLSMGQMRGFPAARTQQLLVMFVRARKASEKDLGGISARRLVSFPVDLRR
jgi:hypothetical protein